MAQNDCYRGPAAEILTYWIISYQNSLHYLEEKHSKHMYSLLCVV